MSKNNPNFADEYDNDPVGALAFTDFTKPTPVLTGKDTERFIKMMEENEREAMERSKRPPTLEELKEQLVYEKMLYDMEKEQLVQRERVIDKIETKIKELENNNGETKEG